MNSSKILVMALAAVTAAVVAFVFVINPMLNNRGSNRVGRGDVPRVAIITPSTVQMILTTERSETVSADDAEAEEGAETATTGAAGAQQETQTTAGEGQQQSSAARREAPAPSRVAEQMLVASIDLLSGALSDRLDRSGRVAIVDPVQVNQVLTDMGRRTTRSRADEGSREDFFRALQNTISGTTERTVVTTEEPAGAGSNDESSSQRTNSLAADSRTRSLDRADISRAATDLQADYLLVVYVTEPQFESIDRRIAGTSRRLQMVRFDPMISFRLIDGATGTVRVSHNMTLPRPVSISYDYYGSPSFGEIREAYLETWQNIAEIVATVMMDEIYPAQISLADQNRLVMDRGSVDGVAVGDVYDVTREVAEVAGAGDVALSEGVRENVGSVQVTRVQETLAFLEPVGGASEAFRRGDRVEFAAARAAAQAEARSLTQVQAGQPAPALGARMRGATTENKPRIAVRDATMRYIDCATCGSADPRGTILADAFMARFQNEPRVTVMTRRDLEASLAERDFSDAAGGQRVRMDEEGMLGAHYLITGTLTVRPQDNSTRERIAGQDVVTARSSQLVGTGEFRIVNAETTEVVETASVRVTAAGGASEGGLRRLANAAAQTASTEFLNRLFPLAVLGQNGDQTIEISGGTQSGLTVGTRLQVFAVGSGMADLYSEQSANSRTRSGVIVVSDVRRDRATGRFEGRSFPINRGDLLEVLPAATRRTETPPVNAPAQAPADRF